MFNFVKVIINETLVKARNIFLKLNRNDDDPLSCIANEVMMTVLFLASPMRLW